MFRHPTIRSLARRLGSVLPGVAVPIAVQPSLTAEKSRGAIARQKAMMKKIRDSNV
jgi:hypothetical protein